MTFVPPRWCLLLPVSHVACDHLEPQLPWPRTPNVWVVSLIPVAQRLQDCCTHPYHRAGSPEPVVDTLWWRLVPPRWCLLLPVSHVACDHLEPQLPWPRTPYVWVVSLIPVAQRLQDCCTHPYHRAGSPEPVVDTLWWRLVPPRWCLLLPVSHVACRM